MLFFFFFLELIHSCTDKLFKIKGKYQYVGVISGSFLWSTHPTTGKQGSIIYGSEIV